MHRYIIVLLAILAGCTTKTPEEAVQAFSATLSDGFQSRAGVAVGDRHAVADLSLIETSESTTVRIGVEAGIKARILNRTEPLGVAILHLDRGVSAPVLGDSGALEEGANLHAGAFGADGIRHITSTVTGIRFHQKRWYLETSLPLAEEQLGTGVFGDDGALVGLYAFELTSELRYVLPIEYVTAVSSGPAANVVEHDASDAFNSRSKEAAASSIELVPPPTFDSLEVRHNFANRDLVGIVRHFQKKDSKVDPAAFDWSLSAVSGDDDRKEIASGSFTEATAQWYVDPDEGKKARDTLVAQFGEAMAAERLDPFERGELRFRVPASAYCRGVEASTAYALVVDLGDGRKTQELTYGDLVNVCAGLEAGEGAAWLEAWGMAADAPKEKKKRKRRRRRRR